MAHIDRIIHLHRKIAPKLIETVENRYNILRYVSYVQPIGRRALADQLDVGERIIRSEIEFLRMQGLLDVTIGGVIITAEGQELLTDLSEYIYRLRGLNDLEIQLGKLLRLEQVHVVAGDVDLNPVVKTEMGRTGARLLHSLVEDHCILAVSGGTTTAELAQATHRASCQLTVVPARGGLGEEVEYQANTIAAGMAKRLGGSYRLMHIPDGLPGETIQSLFQSDAHTREISAVIKQANILIHGIGLARVMAERRSLAPEVLEQILRNGAVGEALGHYFDTAGRVVYATNSAGLRLKDLANIGKVIAIAGGRTKAPAILSVMKNCAHDVLITDEAAAREIIALAKVTNEGGFSNDNKNCD